MSVERIEFSVVEGSEDMFPRPYPANREIPEWFKAMPTDIEGTTTRTLKNCMPFLEAMTCGYIIPLAADITVSVSPAGVFHGYGAACQAPSRYANIVQLHQSIQQKGAPFENCPVVKILNPWLIRTPTGYSTLFSAVLNRFQMALSPLAGLVETDVLYREINFPCVLTIRPGTTLTLPRGTPFVQVIPIKREDFQSEFVPPDRETYDEMDLNTRDSPQKHNYYKNHFWRKKTYR